jgi:hypothetical protein
MNFYFNEPKDYPIDEDEKADQRAELHTKLEKYLEKTLFLYGPGEMKSLLLQELIQLDVWTVVFIYLCY